MPWSVGRWPRMRLMAPGRAEEEVEAAGAPGGLAEGAAGALEEGGVLTCVCAMARMEGVSGGSAAVVESSKGTAVEGPERETSLGEIWC